VNRYHRALRRWILKYTNAAMAAARTASHRISVVAVVGREAEEPFNEVHCLSPLLVPMS
jgi:hypothetical protein